MSNSTSASANPKKKKIKLDLLDGESAVYSYHYTDVNHGDGTHTCTISNWLNYYSALTGWQPASPDVVDAVRPDDWVPADFPFAYANPQSALQAYLVDTVDSSNSTLACLRMAANPSYWVYFRAVGPASKAHEKDQPNKRVKWPGLWAHTDFYWKVSGGKLEKHLELLQNGHPAQFRFSFQLPTGHTYTIANNVLTIFDSGGVEWLRTLPAWAVDAAGVPIEVEVTEGPQSGGLPTVNIKPKASDMAHATYPVNLDPTTVLSGAMAIDDTVLSSANPNNNYGTYIRYHFQNTYNTLVRLNALPVFPGTITGFREKMYVSAAPSPTSIRAYKIKSANTWVEGSGSGSPMSGTSCWNYCKYTTQAWAGAAGCSLDGTDYDSNPSPPTVSITTTGWITLELPPAWVGANMGFIILCSDAFAVAAYSSDSGTTPAYFEIDYVAGGLPPSFRWRRQ